jgi:hypothetical protein
VLKLGDRIGRRITVVLYSDRGHCLPRCAVPLQVRSCGQAAKGWETHALRVLTVVSEAANSLCHGAGLTARHLLDAHDKRHVRAVPLDRLDTAVDGTCPRCTRFTTRSARTSLKRREAASAFPMPACRPSASPSAFPT